MDTRTLTRQLPGTPASIQDARAFIAQTLADNPRCDDAVLMVSEAATNAVRHTASGHTGGTYEVLVTLVIGTVRVEVHDNGGVTWPCPKRATSDGVNGRGVAIVDQLADRWGFQRDTGTGVVWFELATETLVISG